MATYTIASQATTADTLEARGVAEVGSYLLGIVDTEVATFSFSGENAGKVVLADSYDGTENQWNVSIDGGKTWFQTEEMMYQFTEEQLEAINEEEDIRIYFTGADGNNPVNHYIMYIDKAETPQFSTTGGNIYLYANDMENRIIGAPDIPSAAI